MPEKVKRTILVIEDNPDYQELYRHILRQDPHYDYKVFEAENSQAGLKYCHSCTLDCILLDLDLPGSTGMEFLDDLVGQFGRIYWPVVMLTGHGNESIAVQAMKRGVQDYLEKGTFSAEVLRRTITNTIDSFARARRKEKALFDLKKQIRQLNDRTLELKKKLHRKNEALTEANTRLLEQMAKLAAI